MPARQHAWRRAGRIAPIVFLGGIVGLLPGLARAEQRPELDCDRVDCGAVVPGAVRFEPAPNGAPYRIGKDANGQIRGWVARSTDVVDIKAYSGKPIETLVGLLKDGTIGGARVLHHSEPILLVGIPEAALHRFVTWYAGKPATARIQVGAADEGELSVDVISGATVTALAENRTILDTVHALGAAVGVIDQAAIVPGHFVEEQEPWSWQRLVEEKALARLTVSEAEMGIGSSPAPFIDLHFTIADPPQIGRALLGDGEYQWLKGQLAAGEHLLVVLGNGSSSFKGSGFVRGGIFDRVRLEQGLGTVMFSDRDYHNLTRVAAAGAPSFREGAVFITRPGALDPGASFDLVFLGSRYDGRSGFSRDFHATRRSHRLPRSLYVLDGPDPEEAVWRRAWARGASKVVLLAGYLLLVAGIFAGRRHTATRMRRLQRLHLWALLSSFVGLGLFLAAQPSVTQILTFIDSVIGEWRFGLFLSEPLLFVSWIFIAVVTLIWGRGVFCGWVCPYGAGSELLHRLGKRLRLGKLELPERWHRRLRWLRYGILAVLVGVYLVSPVWGERLAEIEPFKTTFFVRPWSRDMLFLGWWLLLLVLSSFWYRPFCRYLCPLGAGLALASSFRRSGPYRRRFCSSCRICARGCEPRAFRDDGSIDPKECLSCMECEATFHDRDTCPPLLATDRLLRKRAENLNAVDGERLRRLDREAERC